MEIEELLTELRHVECLRELEDDDARQLASFGRHVDVAADTIIFREGDPAVAAYLVVEGIVSIEICAPGVGCRRISTISDGELLGWSPVLDRPQLTATARAATPVTLIEFPKRELLNLCEQSPRFGYLFMKGVALTLARRLSATRVQLLNIFGDEAHTKP
jgi:CRP-like cAMP-binding protein